MKNFFIKILFLILLLLSLFFPSCITSNRSYNNQKNRLLKMIKNDPFVSDARVISSDGFFIYEFEVRIEFKNDGSIVVDEVDSRGRGVGGIEENKIMIYYFDDYFIDIRTNNRHIGASLTINILSEMLEIQLINIMDIVENYNIIRQHIENWPIIDDFKKASIMIKENQYPQDQIIIIDGQEYYCFKYKNDK